MKKCVLLTMLLWIGLPMSAKITQQFWIADKDNPLRPGDTVLLVMKHGDGPNECFVMTSSATQSNAYGNITLDRVYPQDLNTLSVNHYFRLANPNSAACIGDWYGNYLYNNNGTNRSPMAYPSGVTNNEYKQEYTITAIDDDGHYTIQNHFNSNLWYLCYVDPTTVYVGGSDFTYTNQHDPPISLSLARTLEQYPMVWTIYRRTRLYDYRVTLLPGEGSGEAQVLEGYQVTLPTKVAQFAPPIQGLTIVGWAHDGDTLPIGATIHPTEDISYTAVYGAPTLLFDVGIHSSNKIPSTTMSPIKLPDIIAEDGYRFLGWSLTPNATQPEYEARDSFPSVGTLSENTTLYAVYEQKEWGYHYREVFSPDEIHDGDDIVLVMSDGNPGGTTHLVTYLDPAHGEIVFEDWELFRQKDEYVFHLRSYATTTNQYYFDYYFDDNVYSFYLDNYHHTVLTKEGACVLKIEGDSNGHFRLETGSKVYLCYDTTYTNRLVLVNDVPPNHTISQFDEHLSLRDACKIQYGKPSAWRIFIAEKTYKSRVLCYTQGSRLEVEGPVAVLPDSSEVYAEEGYRFLYWKAMDNSIYYGGDTISTKEDMSLWAVYLNPGEEWPNPDTGSDWPGDGADGWGYKPFGKCAYRGDTAYKYVRTKVDSVVSTDLYFAYGMPHDYVIETIQVVDSPIIGHIVADSITKEIIYTPYSGFIGVDGCVLRLMDHHHVEQMIRVDFESCNEYVEDGYEFIVSFIRNAYSSEVIDATVSKYYLRTVAGVPTRVEITDINGKTISADVKAQSYHEEVYDHKVAVGDKAIYIRSSAPIVVESHIFDPYSGDATYHLPLCDLDTSYIIQTAQWTEPTKNMFAVVGTQDNTTVTIHLKGPARGHPKGSTYSITLQRGEVYRAEATDIGYGYSFSGSTITANHPIAVYQGTPSSLLIPPLGGNGGACDNLYEQAHPVSRAAAKEFVAVGTYSLAQSYLEFVTTEPNTTVFMGGKTQFCANAYDTAWCIIERAQPVYIKADKPVVGQYFLCGGDRNDTHLSDPDQFYLHPVNDFHQMTMFTCQRISSSFSTLTYRHHGMGIVVPAGSENGIYLDGNLLTGFEKVPYSDSLYYLQYQFPSNKERGVHTIVSRDSGFVASLYGMQSAESYSYALPLMHSHLPLIKEHLYDTICIGQTYQWQGRTLTAQGIYTDTVRNEGQIREVHVLELEVADTTSVDTMAIVCNDSLPYLWHGYSLTVDTMVVDTMSTVHGCDSIVRLHMLTHNCGCETYSYLDTTVAYKKLPFRWFGKKYSQPGLYRDTLIGGNVNGCDSIGQLYLLYHIDYEDSIMVCDNEPVTFSTPWGDVDVGLCDDYNGCLVITEDEDCLVNVHLQVQRIPATSTPRVVNAAICYGEVFDWNGRLLSRDTTILDTILDFHGCDTIFSTMNLHVHPAPIDYIESEEICIADTLWWHGRKLYHTGIYYDTVLSVITGCDSAYCQMHLHTKLCTMPPPPNPRIECDTAYSTIDTTILCSQIPFEWFGKSYSVSGEYHDTLVGASYTFCDSIGTLYLEVETCECDTSYSSKDTTICAPALPLLWEDSTWTAAGTKTKVLTNAVGCDSIVTLTLYVNQPTTSDTTAIACDSIVWHGLTYTMSGDYDYQTTNAAGCDSTRTLHLTINHSSSGTNDTTVCRNDLPLLWEDSTWTDAGVKTKILTNAAGCDSVVTLTLSVNEPTAGDTTATACTSFTWYGTTYTNSGSYTHLLTNAAGCDSTLTLQLTINQPTNGTKDTTICSDALPLLWEDSTWTAAGTKIKVLANAVGCDSIVTLTLYVNQPTTSDTTAIACDSIVWHGVTYTMSGDYDYQTTNAAGCDSTRTLHLTIRYASVGTNDTTVCRNDIPLLWEDSTWTDAGVKTKILTNAAGCDSVVTLTLSVNEPTAGDTAAVACTSFTWYGTTYTNSGSYTHMLTNAAGCDSTLTLQLTINQPTIGDTTAYVCAGTDFYWHGALAQDGAQMTLTNAAGCDSVVTLHLITRPVYHQDVNLTVCDKQMPYTWNGITCTQAGDYVLDSVTAAGCDSVVTLHLSVDVFSASDTAAAICRADLPYTWHGKQLHDAGTLKDTMVNSVLCDSIITLTLIVNEPTTSDTTATACSSFTWHGTTYTASGDYDYQTTNANGCDSTRTLHLTINQPTTGDTTAYVCAGTDYYWHGTLANDGAQLTLTNAAGCDSVVTLHLITKPVSSLAKDTTVCAEALPIVWADSTWTEAGTKIAILTNASGCDSTITLTLHVNNHCCPDTVHNIAEVNICDTLLPYTWTAAHTLTIDQAGEYSDTLRNDDGCDSILYFLTLTTYTCCAPMEATMQVPDVCADDASMEVTVTMQRGAFNAYRVHYTNAPGNAMPFRDTVINDAPADQSSPVTLTLPVPHDAADRTHYPRPDTYGIAMTLYDACGDSLHLASTTFDVLFPSWLLDQHWDDVIAILNDRYNGGYTFSHISWLRDGEEIEGEHNLYIYLPHQLWTTPEEQHHDYAYQALLTRADDGKSILTCPMTPYHIDSTNVLTEPYVAVAPTIVSHENPVVHVMTNTQGTYWIYSLTGKLLRTADYEPCDHEVFDIRLFEAQTMYILVFTPRHETKPLKEKYRAVKVMVE